MKEKKKSSFAVLMHYAGRHKYYSYASVVLAVISAWIALIPFYDVWRIIKEILRVRPDATDEEVMAAARWLRQARLRSLKRLTGSTNTWLRCSFARRNGNTDLNRNRRWEGTLSGGFGLFAYYFAEMFPLSDFLIRPAARAFFSV